MKLRSLRALIAVLGIALAAAVVACLLPENPYQRYQLLDGTIHDRASWMYERVHFDPTPIDVAFVGPSRVGAGIDAPRIEKALAARGVDAHVVNFAVAENGRNLAYALVEEMLTAKTPKLIVIGVIEKPGRFGHPAFKYVARRGLIANPGYAGNVKWPGDLIYLPFRQMRLFGAWLWPEAMGLRATFDPARYRGHSIDTTGSIVLPDGTFKEGEKPASVEELERGVTKLERGTRPPLLPAAYADVEFGDERYYLRKMVALAEAKGVKVAFLALPYYTGPADVQEQAFYERYGPVWNAHFLAPRADLFADYGHLTATGADILSDWVTPAVAGMIAPPGGAAPPAGDAPQETRK